MSRTEEDVRAKTDLSYRDSAAPLRNAPAFPEALFPALRIGGLGSDLREAVGGETVGLGTLLAFFAVTPLALFVAFLLFVNRLVFAAKLVAWTGVAIPATWFLVLASIQFGPSVLFRRRDRKLLRQWVSNVNSIWAYDSMGATHLRLYKAPRVFVDIMGDASAINDLTRWLADCQIKTFESRTLKT